MRLGNRDPRKRRGAAGSTGSSDLDRKTISSASGLTRFAAFDGIAPLAANASLEEVVARLNLLTKRGQGAQ